MTRAKAIPHVNELNAGTQEQLWSDILLNLNASGSRKPIQDICLHYQRLTSAGRPPLRTSEREAFDTLKQAVKDFTYLSIARSKEQASREGTLSPIPCITSIDIREEFFRICEVGLGRELCMLVQIQDSLGRFVVFSNDSLSCPTRNPMLLFVRCRDRSTLSFEYDVLFSRSAFLEEIEILRLMIDPFRAHTRRKALLPVTYFAVERAALSALGRSDGIGSTDRHTITSISSIDRGVKEPPAFLVQVSGEDCQSQRCLVRFTFSSDLPFPITRTTLLAEEGFA